MSHETRYEKFIDSRKTRVLLDGVYTEKHHILPKSLGGTDDPSNIIELTAREHFIAHLILWKMYGGKMTQAFWYMQEHNPHYRKGVWISSRQFESLRKDEAEEQRKRVSGENHPGFGKPSPLRGRKQDPEHVKRRADARRGKKFSSESLERLRKAIESSKGKSFPNRSHPHSLETRKKISESRTGITVSEEARKRMSETRKGNAPNISSEKRLEMAEKERIRRTGKSFDELYGKEKAEEIRENMRLARKRIGGAQ